MEENCDYQRRTCEEHFFPPLRQFWADTVTGDVLWDLAYLHSALKRTDCIEFRVFGKWSSHFSKVVAQFPGSKFHFCEASCLPQHRVANTTAIIAYLWLEASIRCKYRVWQCYAERLDVFASYLVKAANLAIGAIRCTNDGRIELPSDNLQIQIQSDGAVLGMLPMLQGHRTCFKIFEAHWQALEDEQRVRNNFHADRHGIVDIIIFSVTLFQYRHKKGRSPLSAIALSRLDFLCRTIVQWIGGMLQKHAAIYHVNNLNVSRPPPPLVATRTGRQYTMLDPLGVWELAEKARAARTSFQKASGRTARAWEIAVPTMPGLG